MIGFTQSNYRACYMVSKLTLTYLTEAACVRVSNVIKNKIIHQKHQRNKNEAFSRRQHGHAFMSCVCPNVSFK